MLLKTGVFTLTISSHAWSFGKVVFGAFCFGEISMDILLGLSHSHCVKFHLQQIPLLFSSGLSGF